MAILKVQISIPEILEEKLKEKQMQTMPHATLKQYILDALRRDAGLRTLEETPEQKKARIRDTRDRNIRFLFDNGTPAREIAEIFSLGLRTVYRIVQ